MRIDCGSCQEILVQCDTNSFVRATCLGKQVYVSNLAIIVIAVLLTIGLWILLIYLFGKKEKQKEAKK